MEVKTTVNYTPKGVCSRNIKITLNDDNTIAEVIIEGGCPGNLGGISKLLIGMDAQDAIARMQGTTCGQRPTSCPDQIAIALKQALAQ